MVGLVPEIAGMCSWQIVIRVCGRLGPQECNDVRWTVVNFITLSIQVNRIMRYKNEHHHHHHHHCHHHLAPKNVSKCSELWSTSMHRAFKCGGGGGANAADDRRDATPISED